ncbi:hypothetical protein H310_08987 [Aphanomyces invadans]|uniref:Uncharacterized protein n=1 Tax=Aphanomyces invadans TaxID=157072 RepID=A0A024TW99_9STRA|nr:hypothetical protein H310_08987 [Aphanomyces invadans]ETV98274.1 hypothetical protein H310_08987 [Aphanomyces invadans]|eukprot:XP_008873149.1 hypothetical protein H310_08987 [Aphanomyces invadans]
MTGTSARSLHGYAYRPQPAVSSSSNRSNSLRGQTSPYTHSDKDEQLYNLVSDLSHACRKDSNANALKDYNLIETLEKSAKDILARRNSNQDGMNNDAVVAASPDTIQKRRRLSIEANDDRDSDNTCDKSTNPRFQKIERPADNAPKRYNMPTFFSSMPPRQSSSGALSAAVPPPSVRPIAKPGGKSIKSPSAKVSATVDFQDFSDNEDEEPSFMRDTISRETFSRETAMYTREALCMDDLSPDEINMIAPGQEEVHRKRQHGTMGRETPAVSTNKTVRQEPRNDDIQAIMDKAKGSVDPDYVNTHHATAAKMPETSPFSSSSPFSTVNGKAEPEFVYTHLGSKLKSNLRSRSGSGSKERSRRGSVDDKRRQHTITESKLISIHKPKSTTSTSSASASSTASLQASRAQLRSQTMLESKTSWPTGKPTTSTLGSQPQSIPKPATTSLTTAAGTTTAKSKAGPTRNIAAAVTSATHAASVSKEVAVRSEGGKTGTTKPSPPRPLRKEFSLDDTIQDESPVVAALPAAPAAAVPATPPAPVVPVELLQKIESLEKQLASKDAECTRLSTELMAQDAQWKVQFEASDTAYKALEASVAVLASEKQVLATQVHDLERRIPLGDSSSNRIVWHLREILREEESDNKIESAKASRIAALVNRFEKSNAQVQADFAQQLRHEIKSIGLTRVAASLTVDSSTRTADLEERIAQHEATILNLTREAQNYQRQLDLALQTAVDRDQDVMQLESKLTSMQLAEKGEDGAASALSATLASQKAAVTRLEANAAALEKVVSQRDDEKAELERQVQELTRALTAQTEAAAATVASVKKDLEHQCAQVKRLQDEVEAKTNEIHVLNATAASTMTRESASVLLHDSFLTSTARKSVRFEDDEGSQHLRSQVRSLEADVAEMRAALHERTCDVNALRQELVAKAETIEHLSADFAKRLAQQSDVSNPPNDMEKMDMFLFNQVCAKQQEVDDLLVELERKDDEIKELLARQPADNNDGGGHDEEIELLQTKVVELTAQLKVAMEQNALLTQETQLQTRSIESKQNQIKSLLELMKSKEDELAELDEALATAEIQVEYLKQQYNVTFTREEEDGFAAAYRESGRRSSLSLRRESVSYPPNIAPYFTPSAMMDDEGYDEYDRPPTSEGMSVRSDSTYLSTAGISPPPSAAQSLDDNEFGGSPRFSCLSIGSRDSIASSRTSEWGLEF